MAVRIPLEPSPDRYVVSLTLEEVPCALRLYWLERLSGWFVDALDGAGGEVATGLRLTPGAPLALPGYSPSLPPGRFVVLGPDSYEQTDLGETIQLYYLTAAEVGE